MTSTIVIRFITSSINSVILYSPIEFLSIIVLIGSVVFLFYGAGHVDDKPGITLSWIDKIPLDIFAFIVLMVWTYASFIHIIMASPISQSTSINRDTIMALQKQVLLNTSW